MAAEALETLRKRSTSSSPNIPSQDATFLDKVAAHPIISNSINFILQKNIRIAGSYLNFTSRPLSRERWTKRAKMAKSPTRILPHPHNQFPKFQQNITNIKELSKLNLNIESRRRLTMMINFLKLGNRQILGRLDKWMVSVDQRRNKEIYHDCAEELDQDSEANEMRKEIIATMKKMVAVISKLTGNTLPEPARSNVREVLLRLPDNINWIIDGKENGELHNNYLAQLLVKNKHLRKHSNGKVLLLAQESLDVINKVILFCNQHLEKAETWNHTKQMKHEQDLKKKIGSLESIRPVDSSDSKLK